MTTAACGQDLREVAAVLVALAGLRRGQAYAAVGTGPLVEDALAAAAGPGGQGPVRVAVAGGPGDVAVAAARLAPGGRLVGVAVDRAAAQHAAQAVRAVVLWVVPLAEGVAWLARREP